MALTEQILATVPGNPLEGLRRVDGLLQALREDTLPVPNVVKTDGQSLEAVDWDVVVCGGTLGIFLGAALAQKGWRVVVVERGQLRGRDQEWNISRQELQVFRALNLLTEAELEAAIATEYNPARIQFHQGPEFWVRDVLNIGVDPVCLLDTLKQKFLAAGGKLVEQATVESVVVHPNGVKVSTSGETFSGRLVLDAMGHFSPIARQARDGQKPDALCLVVGTCAQGFPKNDTGDLFLSFTPIQNQCQYFWEAFPARDGRTTYLFTYLDAQSQAPTLEELFTDYLNLMPQYQGVELEQLHILRALFGVFPCYRHSPLRSPWDRILPIGDSSGSQSPLSFGGFGAMLRHLDRLTNGIHDALHQDLLNRLALAGLQPYQPNLSVTWLFQRSMSVAPHQSLPPDRINELLNQVFLAMDRLGDPVLRPFLQDVVQLSPLARTLFQTSLQAPGLVAKLIPQVGLWPLVDWMRHYIMLAIYTVLHLIGQSVPSIAPLSPTWNYYWQRWRDALKYGSGRDHVRIG
jgi:lycopene cyclase CruP